MVTDGIGSDKVTICEPLHQGRGPQSVGAVIGEIRLSQDVQSGDGRLEMIVDPEPSHGVMHRRVDAHRHLIRIFVGDLVVHMKQVAILRLDRGAALFSDRALKSR